MYSIISKIEQYGVIPVIEIDSLEHIEPLMDSLIAGGLPVIEITFRTEAGRRSISIIKKKWPDVILGAGTILTVEHLREAYNSGADFGVAPGLNDKIVEEALKIGFHFSPGVATPTEIERAMGYGIKAVKFFPAESLGGIKYLKEIYAPYAHLDIMFNPTGGINPQNLKDYIKFKAVYAVGGTWIARKNAIAANRWQEIRENAESAVAEIKEIKRLREAGDDDESNN